MAAFNAVNYARKISVPSVKIPPGQEKGQIFVAYDEYTTLANLALNDTINLSVAIPPGAKVHSIASTVPTNGGTLSIGVAGTAAKYASGLTVGKAMTTVLVDNANLVEDNLIVTCTVAATGVGLYQFGVYFTKI